MALVGYARVSSVGQSLDVQEEKLQDAGVIKLYKEKRSGLDSERPALKDCMEYMREGDVLVITKVDRLARSAEDLLRIINELEGKDIGLKVLDQPVDTTTSTGKAFLGMLAVFAQFETDIRKERQMDGIAKAKEKGIKFGRKPVLTAEQEEELIELRGQGLSLQKVADQMGISKGLVHKVLKANDQSNPTEPHA